MKDNKLIFYNNMRKNKSFVKKLCNGINFFPVFLLGLNYLFYNTDNVFFDKSILRIVSIVLTIMFLILDMAKVEKNINMLEVFILFLLSIQIFYSENSVNFLVMILFSLYAKKFSSDDIEYSFFLINLFLLIIWGILAVCGELNFEYTTYSNRFRFNLGFSNVNSGALFFLSIIMSLSLFRGKHQLFRLLISTIFIIVLYSLTNTRSVVISWFVYVIVYFFLYMIRHWEKKKIISMVFVGFLFIIICSWLVVFIDNEQLDSLLSGRIFIFSEYIKDNHLLNLFIGGTNIVPVDNLYLVMTYSVGVFITFPLYIIIWKVLKKMLILNDYSQFAFVISCLILGLVESSVMRPEIMLSFFFFITVFTRFGNKTKLIAKLY